MNKVWGFLSGGLTDLIPIIHKWVPDADKAAEISGKIALASINKINGIVWSSMAAIFGLAWLFQCYQLENGLPMNSFTWLTFFLKLIIFLLLLGVEAKRFKDFWKVMQDVQEDANINN